MAEQITINESGAFIPRSLFGREADIVDSLRQVGVLPATNGAHANGATVNGHAAVEPPPAKPRERPPLKPMREVKMPDMSREMRWIKEHRHEYAGQWVALDGDQLLAHGMNAREVFEAARQHTAEPFFAHLEPADALPFGGW